MQNKNILTHSLSLLLVHEMTQHKYPSYLIMEITVMLTEKIS